MGSSIGNPRPGYAVTYAAVVQVFGDKAQGNVTVDSS